MAKFGHLYKLAALKYSSGAPLNAFMHVSPRVNAEGYEINPLLLDMLHTKKFAGDDDTEDPYAHIDFFEQICGTLKLNALSDDEVKHKLFNQTLSDKAHVWYKACPGETIDTWKKLSATFLSQFSPKSKSYGARRMITNFKNR